MKHRGETKEIQSYRRKLRMFVHDAVVSTTLAFPFALRQLQENPSKLALRNTQKEKLNIFKAEIDPDANRRGRFLKR